MRPLNTDPSVPVMPEDVTGEHEQLRKVGLVVGAAALALLAVTVGPEAVHGFREYVTQPIVDWLRYQH
jgi:hypothetical protein